MTPEISDLLPYRVKVFQGDALLMAAEAITAKKWISIRDINFLGASAVYEVRCHDEMWLHNTVDKLRIKEASEWA